MIIIPIINELTSKLKPILSTQKKEKKKIMPKELRRRFKINSLNKNQGKITKT